MSLDCVVEDDQLSLAIGKKGQNVRLASALIGLKIEIKGETEVKGEVAQALTRMLELSRQRQVSVAEVPGIGEKTAERLIEAGINTLADLLEKTAPDLAAIPGIGEKSAEKIVAAAGDFERTRAAAAQTGEPAGEPAAELPEQAAEGAQEGAQEPETETAQETTVRQ